MWPKTIPSQLTAEDLKAKRERDREYRDKRLTVAAQLYSMDRDAKSEICLRWADELIRANEEMAVPQ